MDPIRPHPQFRRHHKGAIRGQVPGQVLVFGLGVWGQDPPSCTVMDHQDRPLQWAPVIPESSGCTAIVKGRWTLLGSMQGGLAPLVLVHSRHPRGPQGDHLGPTGTTEIGHPQGFVGEGHRFATRVRKGPDLGCPRPLRFDVLAGSPVGEKGQGAVTAKAWGVGLVFAPGQLNGLRLSVQVDAPELPTVLLFLDIQGRDNSHCPGATECGLYSRHPPQSNVGDHVVHALHLLRWVHGPEGMPATPLSVNR